MRAQRQFAASPRILCVDDREHHTQLRKAFLEHSGCEVIAVLDARSALRELTGQGKFDLALVDYHLGTTTNGADLARDNRTILPTLPMIMLTGDPTVPDSEKSTVDLWLIKGHNSPAELLAAIERLIPGKTLRRQPIKKVA